MDTLHTPPPPLTPKTAGSLKIQPRTSRIRSRHTRTHLSLSTPTPHPRMLLLAHLHHVRVLRVGHQRREQLHHVLPPRPRVGHAQAHAGAAAHGVRGGLHLVRQERQGRVALVAHATDVGAGAGAGAGCVSAI